MAKTTVDATRLREVLGNVVLHASKDTAVTALHAVQLSCDGVTLTATATDRYTIGTDTEPVLADLGPSDEFTTLLDVDDVKRIIAATKDVPRGMSVWPVEIIAEDDVVTVSVTYAGTSLRCVARSAEFPKVQSILQGTFDAGRDDANAIPHIALNAQLLAKFAKVKDGGRSTAPMRLSFSSPLKAALVEVGDTFRGVIMPVRYPWPEVVATAAA